MFNQNLLFRQRALDRFDDLVLRVSQDPAMLIWLDNITNVLGRPNENFARELMELFTMGIRDVVTDDVCTSGRLPRLDRGLNFTNEVGKRYV